MPKLDYNFTPTYDTLPGANVDIKITDVTGVDVLSAYAGELGKLTYVPLFLSASPEISNLNYKIDFGDGTISKDVSGKHYYETPGDYTVSLVVTSSAGNLFKSNITKVITVTDIIPDIIHLSYGENIYAKAGIGFDIGDQPPSTIAQEIIVTRYNSSITSSLMKQNNYKINLSVEGNESKFYTQQDFNLDNNFQLKNASFFANNRTFEFDVIDSIETDSIDIYAGYTKDKELIVKSVETLTEEESKFTLNVGTSGSGTFYYYSDYNTSNLNPTTEAIINCLPHISDVTVTGNVLYINSFSLNHGIYIGEYILNVPIETPLAILNKGNESKINIVSGELYGNKNVYNTSADGNYDFYYGKVKINVNDNFNTINLHTFNEGKLSGDHTLNYTPTCNTNSLRSKL